MNKSNAQLIVSLLLFMMLSAVIFTYDYILGFLFLILVLIFLIIVYIALEQSNKESDGIKTYIGSKPNGFEYRLDQILEPVLLIDAHGNYHWYNEAFYQSFYSNTRCETKLAGRNIKDELNILPEQLSNNENIKFSCRSYDYKVVTEVINKSGERFYLLHFFKLQPQLNREVFSHNDPIFCYIVIDNYDEIMDELTNGERAQASRNLTVILTEWANKKGGFILSYENDRYLVIFDREKIDFLMEKGFRILDEVRGVITPQGAFTLSIGIGLSDKYKSISEASDLSVRALKIAQERGGDQAVIKHDNDLTVFGGRRETKCRQTRTRTRVKGEKLKELIEHSDNVLIVGHQNPDMDCFGAGVGLIDACRDMNKTAKYIFRNKNSVNFELLKEYLKKSPNYDNSFITSSEALDLVRDKTLLIVVDTRSTDYIDCPEILDKVEDIVIIDHHLQPKNVIEDTALSYIEPAASSASELVARVLEYFDSKTVLTPFGANALMAGIFMDTRQFAQHIGVCTFEAAAYLTRKGADMSRTRNLLRDDFLVLSGRSTTTKNAQFYYDGIFAVAMCEDYTENGDRIKSSSADDLLNVKGVEASFVLLKSKDGITISARSSEDVDEGDRKINVCQILEGLGGGGHFNMAGAQLHSVQELAEAKELLLEQIGRYVDERKEDFESNIT